MISTVPFPVSAFDVAQATKLDNTLSVVHDCVLSGSKLPNEENFASYSKIKESLNSEQGVLLYLNRVVIPTSLQGKLLDMLHEGHMGITKTKGLARSYIWWPNLDSDIEVMVNSCMQCQLHRNHPPAHNAHSWEHPEGPWQHLHIDFAGPFKGHMFMIIVDAYSKWPEIVLMNSTTTSNTIEALKLFARNGYPLSLVSDNGSQFIASEFTQFMQQHGIVHTKCAPYHPASNGEAERFVQTFKNYVRISNVEPCELEEALLKFLTIYRTSPHSTTGYSTSYLICNWQIRTCFDLLKPHLTQRMNQKSTSKQDKLCKPVSLFDEGSNMLMRNYTKEGKWLPGVVHKKTGSLHFIINVNGKFYKRHIDQLKLLPSGNPVAQPRGYIFADDLGQTPESSGDYGNTPDPPVSCTPTLPKRTTRGIPPPRLNL